MKSRTIAILALIIYCLPIISYAVDPIEFTQGQAQNSPEMQIVIEQLSTRFLALSSDRQMRFLARMDRVMAKAQKKLGKISEQTFGQQMKRTQEKLAKRSENVVQAAPSADEKVEVQAISELNHLTKGLYVPNEGPVVIHSFTKEQASEGIAKAREAVATASANIQEIAMKSAKHLKGRAIAMDSQLAYNLIAGLALIICIVVPFIIGILCGFVLIAALGLALAGVVVWGLGMIAHGIFFDPNN